MWRHVGTGTGGQRTALSARKPTRRFGDETFVDTRALARIVERERIDGDAQFVDAVHVLRHEVAVEHVVFENLANESRQKRRVLPRPHRQIEVGIVGNLGEARVDDDEEETVLLQTLQTHQRIEAGQATRVAEAADDRVASDDTRNIGRVECMHSGSPRPMSQRCDGLARLVD